MRDIRVNITLYLHGIKIIYIFDPWLKYGWSLVDPWSMVEQRELIG